LCDAYVKIHEPESWAVLMGSTEHQRESKLSVVTDYVNGVVWPENTASPWHADGVVLYGRENGDVGVCTLIESPQCARGFFVFSGETPQDVPREYRISMTCGAL
jgi:hypothetical protein